MHVCLAHACVFMWKRTFMNVYVGSRCWSTLYTGLHKVQVFSVRPWFLSPYPTGFKRLTFLLDPCLCAVALGSLYTNLSHCRHQLTDFFYCSCNSTALCIALQRCSPPTPPLNPYWKCSCANNWFLWPQATWRVNPLSMDDDDRGDDETGEKTCFSLTIDKYLWRTRPEETHLCIDIRTFQLFLNSIRCLGAAEERISDFPEASNNKWTRRSCQRCLTVTWSFCRDDHSGLLGPDGCKPTNSGSALSQLWPALTL